MARGTLDALVVPASEALVAVGELIEVDDGAQLITDLGYKVPSGSDLPALFNELGNSADELGTALSAVTAAYEDGSWQDASFMPKVIELAKAVGAFAQAANALVQRAQTVFAGMQDFLDNAPIDELPRRLLDYLLVRYLRSDHPRVAAALEVLGATGQTFVPAGAYNPDFYLITVRWERVQRALTDPHSIMADEYAWGSVAFHDDLLLERLNGLLWLFGVTGSTVDETDTADPAAPPPPQFQLPLYSASLELPGEGYTGIGVGLRLRRSDDPADPDNAGLALVPYVDGSASTELPLREGWGLILMAALSAEGLEIILRPATGVELAADASISGAAGVTLARHGDVLGPIVLLGDAQGTRLEIAEVSVGAAASFASDGTPDFGVEIKLDGVQLVIDAAEGDGFLKVVLPSDPITVSLDMLLGISRNRGFYIQGAGGLEYTFALHVTIGPLSVDSVDLAIDLDTHAPSLEVAATGGLQLGPLAVAVKGIGLRTNLALDHPGNLGSANLELGFKPPDGAALSIDGGAVTGGGFLFFDPEKEQYAGGLHLDFEELTLNAIGLLTTRMPDGSRGFSLLVIVQASGFAPIQLGFGFTLNGVGGLLAINRTVAVDVLRAGVRNKTLDTILFSEDDPTPRAPQIVSTLQTVFPPAPNQYVFGPMALIGWGTPTLLTIELALILELPAPLRLIVLGRLRAALPDPEHAIVSINLDVVGVIDFDRSELSVDASLYDSRVGPFALTGDMAARASWGSTPDFAMALGGFHPAYKPPPGFPQLRRLALALSTGNNPRVRMEAYFALTSNTVQVGARLELYVEAAGFSLEGGLGFDTLIQFSPFHLLAEIYAHLALKRGSTTLMGLDIHVHLTGPAPWVLWGEASFKILFISISIPFRATIGRAEETPAIERQEVWEKLRDGLLAPTSWTAQLPPGSGRLVVLRGEAADGEVLAHPLGSLAVSQRVVPLERTLEMFGAVPPKDFDRFEIVGAGGLTPGDKTTDYFAPAQFRRMDDAEKLSSPSFERMVSGVRLSPSNAVQTGYVQETPLDYEQSVVLDIDQPKPERVEERYQPDGSTVAALAEHGPAGTAELREQGRAKFAPEQPGPVVAEPTYVVAKKDELELADLDGLDGTYTGAVERLRSRADRDELQVVREEEVSLA